MFREVIKKEIDVLENEIKQIRSNIDSCEILINHSVASKKRTITDEKMLQTHQIELQELINQKEKKLIYAFSFLFNN